MDLPAAGMATGGAVGRNTSSGMASALKHADMKKETGAKPSGTDFDVDKEEPAAVWAPRRVIGEPGRSFDYFTGGGGLHKPTPGGPSSPPTKSSPIPPLTAFQHSDMGGTTRFSNWVIPGLLMMGAKPAAGTEDLATMFASQILESGARSIIDLRSLDDKRRARTDIHYPWVMQKVLDDWKAAGKVEADAALEFIEFPITDGSVAKDEDVKKLVMAILSRIRRRVPMYLHCIGGHGRSGTIAAIVLGIVFNVSSTEALNLIARFHDTRIDTQDAGCPETQEQRVQVHRLLAANSVPHDAAVASAPKAWWK